MPTSKGGHLRRRPALLGFPAQCMIDFVAHLKLMQGFDEILTENPTNHFLSLSLEKDGIGNSMDGKTFDPPSLIRFLFSLGEIRFSFFQFLVSF
jgi:hypothetical protein